MRHLAHYTIFIGFDQQGALRLAVDIVCDLGTGNSEALGFFDVADLCTDESCDVIQLREMFAPDTLAANSSKQLVRSYTSKSLTRDHRGTQRADMIKAASWGSDWDTDGSRQSSKQQQPDASMDLQAVQMQLTEIQQAAHSAQEQAEMAAQAATTRWRSPGYRCILCQSEEHRTRACPFRCAVCSAEKRRAVDKRSEECPHNSSQ